MSYTPLSVPKAWEPTELYKRLLAEALAMGRKRIIERKAPVLDDQWVVDNFDKILKLFIGGRDQKAVAGLMGVPWQDWADLTMRSVAFRDTIALGIQLRLSMFEEMRNAACRGQHRGNVAAITHALDRQHADAYYGRPSGMNPEDDGEELTLDQANRILEGYGIKNLPKQ